MGYCKQRHVTCSGSFTKGNGNQRSETFNTKNAIGCAKSDILDESLTYRVTRKSFHYGGKLSFLHAFLAVAKTAAAVFMAIPSMRSKKARIWRAF